MVLKDNIMRVYLATDNRTPLLRFSCDVNAQPLPIAVYVLLINDIFVNFVVLLLLLASNSTRWNHCVQRKALGAKRFTTREF